MPVVEANDSTKIDLGRIDPIIDKYRQQRWGLLPLLQEVQGVYGYIPPQVIPQIAGGLGLFPSQVQGVISFYALFYTEPRGKNVVRVCRGTACHVRGGKTILKLVKKELGLEEGETTADLEYTLETVACIGICALAPNMVINNNTYGQMNPRKVARLLGRKDR